VNSNIFEITNKDMTRFSITINEAISFVLDCLNKMRGSEIFIPKIPSYRLLDLVMAFSQKPKIKIIGIRAGEKIHEEMVSVYDSRNAIECNNFYIIYPDDKLRKDGMIRLKGKSYPKNYSYSSDKNIKFLNIKELKLLIKEIKNKI
jgi:UDP-N-acetylglucosamine 4,6-dehydratase